MKQILISYAAAFLSLTPIATAESIVIDSDFAFAGQYIDAAGSGQQMSIDKDRHLELFPSLWSYSRPLLKDDERSFHVTGSYQASNGCVVGVETTLDFAADGNSVNVQFDRPHTIVRGPFGGCTGFGVDTFRYNMVKSTSNPSKNWIRKFVGSGCGRAGANQAVVNQASQYTQSCTKQGGASNYSTDRLPSCGPVDPNDLSCPFGVCSLHATFSCSFPTP